MMLQAQEGLISQLCDENLKLGEEIERLNSRSAVGLLPMHLVLSLSSTHAVLLAAVVSCFSTSLHTIVTVLYVCSLAYVRLLNSMIIGMSLRLSSVCLCCSMKLVKDLSDENSRLLRDNKRANESLDGMVKDIAELNNRLLNIAFQSPEDGGDVFDDAFADPAELAERAEKRKKAALDRQTSATDGARAVTGMDDAMKKRQEATAAEVCCAFILPRSVQDMLCTATIAVLLVMAHTHLM